MSLCCLIAAMPSPIAKRPKTGRRRRKRPRPRYPPNEFAAYEAELLTPITMKVPLVLPPCLQQGYRYVYPAAYASYAAVVAEEPEDGSAVSMAPFLDSPLKRHETMADSLATQPAVTMPPMNITDASIDEFMARVAARLVRD